VCQVDTGKVFTYTLVNAREANASEQRISVDSPVGRQLLGRREGDEVVVEAPSRVIHLRIESVSQG
jgi:transcription elongation factor GreA